MNRITVPTSGHRTNADGWRTCVGTGRLGLGLRQDWLDSLSLVQDEIGFTYLRGHGLFHDDLGIRQVYEWEGEQRVAYNFTYVDQLFDNLLARRIRPFLELGFMPDSLASGNQTVFWWRGNVTPPKDYDQWCEMVTATLRHFVARYGLDEVRTWPIEVWNEPNLQGFWENADQSEYFRLYEATARAVKAVDEQLQVGGPAICGGGEQWMHDFLDFCREHRVPVDFLSRHAYATGLPEPVPFSCYQSLAPVEHLLDDFRSGREVCAEHGFDLPVHVTEFSTSYKPCNPLHDTCFNAAYLARTLSEGTDLTDSFSYWTFCDVFEEEGIPQAPFHGGFGLLTHRQVKKPTFHLYAFFARLGDEILYRDEHCQVRRGADGSVSLVAWNPVPEPGDGDEVTLQLELPLSDGPVMVTRERVNEEHGNPWGAWQAMGRPRFPTEQQWKLLRQLAEPAREWSQCEAVAGVVVLDLRLTRNEVTLVELRPVRDETPTYPGLDDRRIPGYGRAWNPDEQV